MGRPEDPRTNHLLAALPAAEWERWQHLVQGVELPLGLVLKRPGQAQSHVVFPTTAIVSVMMDLQDGGSIEVATIGCEGLIGSPQFMGGASTRSRAVVQTAGHGFQVCAARLQVEFDRCGPAMHLLLLHTQAVISQLAQTAVCNRHHSLEQKLCRWMLHHLDRLPGNELVVTHEAISQFLGVRREGVTEAMLHLQAAGLVHSRRGHVTVLDRAGLAQRSCECYAVVRAETQRLLPDTAASVHAHHGVATAGMAERRSDWPAAQAVHAAASTGRGAKPINASARAV